MPELVEVKIMSEYINKVSEGKTFINVRKSDVSKSKTNLKGSWSGQVTGLLLKQIKSPNSFLAIL